MNVTYIRPATKLSVTDHIIAILLSDEFQTTVLMLFVGVIIGLSIVNH